MDLVLLIFCILVFYAIVFLVSDNYFLPKLDRYLDRRNKFNDEEE